MLPPMLHTPRLTLRRFVLEDADFILELLNDPGWIRNIGDRGVRTLAEACAYLANGPMKLYERLGFGLYLVALRDTGVRIGMCGLVKRDGLDDVDIGFAFLPAWRGNGYAIEASRAVLDHPLRDLGLGKVVAIVSPGNEASVRVLERIGLRAAGVIRLPREAGAEVLLYERELSSSAVM
jgi:RimJ/RimL family protein N-acetyltransferase